MRLICLIMSLLFFFNAFGSPTKVAGGGFVVKCKKPSFDPGFEYTTYDIWEQSSLFKKVPYGLKGETWQEKVNFAISRISKFEPYLASIINQSFQSLLESFEYLVVPRIMIPDFQDYREVIGFENCEKIPAAMQLKSPLYGQYRFYFSEEVWNNLDSFNRATLVLHEILYKSFIATKNEKYSDFVRYYNFIISSDLMESMTEVEYFKYRFARQYSVIAKVKETLNSIMYLLMTEVNAGFYERFPRTINLLPIALVTPEIDPYGATIALGPNGFDLLTLSQIIRTEHKSTHNIMLYMYGPYGVIEGLENLRSIKLIRSGAYKNEDLTIGFVKGLFGEVHKFVDQSWERFLKSLFPKKEGNFFLEDLIHEK